MFGKASRTHLGGPLKRSCRVHVAVRGKSRDCAHWRKDPAPVGASVVPEQEAVSLPLPWREKWLVACRLGKRKEGGGRNLERGDQWSSTAILNPREKNSHPSNLASRPRNHLMKREGGTIEPGFSMRRKKSQPARRHPGLKLHAKTV